MVLVSKTSLCTREQYSTSTNFTSKVLKNKNKTIRILLVQMFRILWIRIHPTDALDPDPTCHVVSYDFQRSHCI